MMTATLDQTMKTTGDILDGYDGPGWQDRADAFELVPFEQTDFTLDPSAFDDEVNTPTHPDAFEPTEADQVAATGYRIGLSGDFASFSDLFPGRPYLTSVYYDSLGVGRQDRARREGFEAGMSWHTHNPTCLDESNPQAVAFCAGVIAGQAQLAADRDEALAELEDEADIEGCDWHSVELAEVGAGYRLVRAEGGGW